MHQMVQLVLLGHTVPKLRCISSPDPALGKTVYMSSCHNTAHALLYVIIKCSLHAVEKNTKERDSHCTDIVVVESFCSSTAAIVVKQLQTGMVVLALNRPLCVTTHVFVHGNLYRAKGHLFQLCCGIKRSHQPNKPDFGGQMCLVVVWIAWCERTVRNTSYFLVVSLLCRPIVCCEVATASIHPSIHLLSPLTLHSGLRG